MQKRRFTLRPEDTRRPPIDKEILEAREKHFTDVATLPNKPVQTLVARADKLSQVKGPLTKHGEKVAEELIKLITNSHHPWGNRKEEVEEIVNRLQKKVRIKD